MRKTNISKLFVSFLSLALAVSFSACQRQVDPSHAAATSSEAVPSSVSSEAAPVPSSSSEVTSSAISSTSSSEVISGAPSVDFEDGIALGKGLVLGSLSNYAGMYMEDGSNEIVSNIMSAEVTNTAEEDLQLARITITYADSVREFEVTNLPAGAAVILLEKNRQSLPEGDFTSAAAENIAFFSSPMDTHEDIFEISGMDGALNVKNISSGDISGDIYVYYKYAANDVFFGGITFRTKVDKGLKAGEIRQVMTGHYDPDNCVITMVTYGE